MRDRTHRPTPPRKAALAGFVALALCGVVAASRTARAAPPDPDLLARLALNEQQIEATTRRASYRAEEFVEQVDGDGKVSSTKTTRYRVEADGTTVHRIVETAVEDGKDVTADEQEKVRGKEAERASKKHDETVWPFAPGSQARYTYDQLALDPARPGYVQIAFAPKNPDSHSFEGKVWVDVASARILTASVRLSKPPMLVDWVHFTAEFGSTPAGPALSHLTFEGAGGLLFVRKHFRGHVKTSDWRAAP
jgi:hypothetical protein